MVFYKMYHCMYSTMYSCKTIFCISITKIKPSGTFIISCNMYSMLYKLVYTLIFCC